MAATSAASRAWLTYGAPQSRSESQQADRYALLGSIYAGTWRNDVLNPWKGTSSPLYPNTRLVVNGTDQIVEIYAQLVYKGDLPSEADALADVSQSAIPIDPETGGDRTNAQLLAAIFENFQIWQWRSQVSLIPRTAAIFGDVLVELVDDYQRGVVMPNIVAPWKVPDIDLDLDDGQNIKRYALEYQVTVPESTAFGQITRAETYEFRKEVDKRAFRYYKDGKPFAYPDIGPAEQPNPYGFVPACLFRHERRIDSDRGIGAFEKSLPQLLELNSTLSAATDYQRKQFGAPIGVKGSALGAQRGRTVTMPGGITLSASTTPADVEAGRLAAAEQLNLLPLSDNGEFVTIAFDIGQTMQVIDFQQAKFVADNPQAEWASKLFGLTQATGPGMQRILSPIIGSVEAVRQQQDPQMVKLCQMGVSIMGFRLNSGAIPAEIVAARPARYEAFRPFDLTSYGRGLLDCSIPSREVFPESNGEKAQWLAVAADLPGWALRELGISEEDIAAQEADTAAAREAQLAAFSVAAAGQGQEGGSEGVTGPSGPSGPTGIVR